MELLKDYQGRISKSNQKFRISDHSHIPKSIPHKGKQLIEGTVSMLNSSSMSQDSSETLFHCRKIFDRCIWKLCNSRLSNDLTDSNADIGTCWCHPYQRPSHGQVSVQLLQRATMIYHCPQWLTRNCFEPRLLLLVGGTMTSP